MMCWSQAIYFLYRQATDTFVLGYSSDTSLAHFFSMPVNIQQQKLRNVAIFYALFIFCVKALFLVAKADAALGLIGRVMGYGRRSCDYRTILCYLESLEFIDLVLMVILTCCIQHQT